MSRENLDSLLKQNFPCMGEKWDVNDLLRSLLEWKKEMLGTLANCNDVIEINNSQLKNHEKQIKKLQEENKELKDLLSTSVPAAEEGAVISPEGQGPVENLEGDRRAIKDIEQKVPVPSWTNNGKFDPVAFFKHIKSKYFPDPLDIIQKTILYVVENYQNKDKIAFNIYSKTFVDVFSPGIVNSVYLKLKGNQFRYVFMLKPDNFVGDLQKPLKEPYEAIDKFQFLIGVDNELYIALTFLPACSSKTQLYKINPLDYEANVEFILSELDKWKKEKESPK